MNDSLNCYGKYSSGKTECTDCLYRDSCRYYAATADSVDRRLKLASFERIGNWLEEAADYEHVPGMEREREPGDISSALAHFFRYLLELDDYAIGIITEIIAPSDPQRKRCSVSYLGKLHGCSRQAMHRKMLKIIGAKPELSGLFRETMYKLGSARQRFLRRAAAAAIGN